MNHNIKLNYFVKSVLFLMLASFISGCAATNTMISKRNLDVQTKMSETVFLDPVSPDKRTIYIEVKNTSGKNIPMADLLKQEISGKGFQVIDDPEKANFMLQANLLKLDKMTENEANSALSSGFGGLLVGVAVASSVSESGRGLATGGLIGGAAGLVANALVKDVYYVLLTDLQIKERAMAGETVVQTQNTNVQQGSSTNINQQITGANTNWKIYRTRVCSTANKVNLKFEEAQPVVVADLSKVVAGFF